MHPNDPRLEPQGSGGEPAAAQTNAAPDGPSGGNRAQPRPALPRFAGSELETNRVDSAASRASAPAHGSSPGAIAPGPPASAAADSGRPTGGQCREDSQPV